MRWIRDIFRVKSLRQELELAQRELARLEGEYAQLTSNIAASIIIQDSDFSVKYCSPYTEVLTGYSLSEIFAKDKEFVNSILHPQDVERYRRALGVVEMGEPFHSRFRFLHKSGLEMWAELRMVPIDDLPSEKLGILTIALDVTATVNYQQLIEEQNRDLYDYAYMVSHDLKAPIYTIKGMVNVIREDFPKPLAPELAENLSHIEKAAIRLESLVRAVIDYSSASSAELARGECDLLQVLRDVVSDYSATIKQQQAEITLPSGSVCISGDSTALYQIFSNLIGNALKYREPTQNPIIKISAEPSSDQQFIKVTVSDNGIGIPANQLENIFRPFKRATARYEGSGIGLAIVKKFCSRLGGSISVQSTAGIGTQFFVSLRKP